MKENKMDNKLDSLKMAKFGKKLIIKKANKKENALNIG